MEYNSGSSKALSEHSLSHSTASDLLGLEAYLHPTNLAAFCNMQRMGDSRRETYFYKIGKKAGWCS